MALLISPAARAQSGVNTQQFATWGLEVFGEIQSELRRPNSQLYAETVSLSSVQSGGAGGFAYVWPQGIQFRVLNALARRDPPTYSTLQRAFSDELVSRYWRFSTAGGYRSGVPSGSAVFYDDNAHIAVAELDAYTTTGDPVFLQRARDTYQFVKRGESSVGGGGIWFVENDFEFKDSVPTLQGARAAAMLYRATGEASYLADAQRLYSWADTTTQVANGLFWEKLYVAGAKAGQLGDNKLVNSIGMAISTNIELFKATSSVSYLNEAKRLGAVAIAAYTDSNGTRRINDEGFWAFELIDALVSLYEVDPATRWADASARGLEYLHSNKRDANGHYGKFWGREANPTTPLSSWNLIDQAPVARAYLSLSMIEPGLAGDYNNDGVVDAADYTTWRDRVGESSIRLPNARGAGPVGLAQLDQWRGQYGAQTSDATSAASSIPEPDTGLLAASAGALLTVAVRRQLQITDCAARL